MVSWVLTFLNTLARWVCYIGCCAFPSLPRLHKAHSKSRVQRLFTLPPPPNPSSTSVFIPHYNTCAPWGLLSPLPLRPLGDNYYNQPHTSPCSIPHPSPVLPMLILPFSCPLIPFFDYSSPATSVPMLPCRIPLDFLFMNRG